ncbi:protein kinase TDA1 KNAG_0D02790 [Huiozyma naganishii CBS 8797]|uniref:Protein kinase domain-containing protein n=1 Tax=Huiozyma naganishii (strain ATCC MYA-139 / BCRC 22969 / CBS 8797 / KCTC 17520 / NBRC 10181 / NCYC 3082 / Yp74L-3) TaxID=1071383 RepID=J7RKK9_HUIN7|nr:hypothetical protein KNAG_0D02790 [Kazachstania naganishii CBS 8797]CCK70028.1 hypothetical protein KNAG_0D02790 [Kazachstania naganishii CBS 8797]
MEENWPQRASVDDTKDAPEAYKCKYITLEDALGDGNFSVVRECMNIETKETYAMKLVRKKLVHDKIQLIQREFTLLKRLSKQIRYFENIPGGDSTIQEGQVFLGHHHILQLFDYFETCDNIVLITQLCAKDDLYEKITQHNDTHLELKTQVVPYTACLVSVLDFLHRQGVVHRDIKAENVLFRTSKAPNGDPSPPPGDKADYDVTAHDLILGDFGLAVDMSQLDKNSSSLKEYVGTISYISPEIVKCKGIGAMDSNEIAQIDTYGTEVDIWALGVLVLHGILDTPPFDCETDEETLECIAKCDYYIDEEKVNDPEYEHFWNFIQCCFVEFPKARRTSRSLTKHPFIRRFFVKDTTKESQDEEFPPALVKHNSLTALHTLKSPLRRNGSSLSTHSTTNSSANSSRVPSQANLISIANITPPDSQPLDVLPTVQDINVTKLRNSLRKTLSMTSMKTMGQKVKEPPQPNKLAKTSVNSMHSTFFLDPQPPSDSLMNGCFCETPKTLSNFNTTPKSSVSSTRENSYKNVKAAYFDLNFDKE